MSDTTIRFDDGAAYERYMGVWSQGIGTSFLAWLAPPLGGRWLDVGCGNGAFTELMIRQCQPTAITGIDPSEAQLNFARTRSGLEQARFDRGDAMALPYADDTFDVAVMPLVIFFVPDPARGVAEMVRVVRPGGLVAAYAWDLLGGGFPYEILQAVLRDMGVPVPVPPHPEAAHLATLQTLWSDAGLTAVTTRAITTQRTFADFDDYWTTILGGPSSRPSLMAMTPTKLEELKTRLRTRLPTDADGRITYAATAHAVTGRVATA